MQAKEHLKGKQKRKTLTRILMFVLAILVVLILLVVLLLPMFVSSERARQIILARINSSIDGRVDFADLSMSWFKGLKVTDFSFNDTSGQTSVRANQITTKPRYSSIFTGSLSLGRMIIDQPKVQINLKTHQPEKHKPPAQEVSTTKRPELIALPIKEIDLIVNNGNLKITDAKARTTEVTEISSRLTLNLPRQYPAGQMGKLLANLRAKARLGFAKAQYAGWEIGPTETEIQAEDGLLKIDSFSSKVNDGRLNFTGQADFNRSPVLLKTAEPIQLASGIKIGSRITEKLLIYLNPIFADAVNVSGIINFNCERLIMPLAGGGRNDIELVGTVSIDQLQLQASDLLSQILSLVAADATENYITIQPTRFIVQNSFIRYDDMQINIGDNPLNFKGVIGLDRSLNMAVTLPYTLKGKTAKVGEEVTGERITLPLKGSIGRPELDLGRLFEEQLKQQLQNQLKEKLDGRLEDELGKKLLEGLEELLKSE